MEMFYIVLLVFFGLLFLVAELVLLPGVSIGAVLALVCENRIKYLEMQLAYKDQEIEFLKKIVSLNPEAPE